MHFDVVTLSRLQFALTIMFHYLFPPLTIGMGTVLVYLEARYLYTGQLICETAAKFWTQLFAILALVTLFSLALWPNLVTAGNNPRQQPHHLPGCFQP